MKRTRSAGDIGRPTKLTPERQAAICSAIGYGSFIETAVIFGGVNKSTFYEWLKRGQREEAGIYKDFSDAIKKALAEGEMKHLANIAHHSSTQWQASAWILERRFPQHWAKDRTESREQKVRTI